MEILVKSVLLLVGLLLFARESFQANDISFQEKPKDFVRAQLTQDVSLGWGFSYGDSTGITGPWDAQGVDEISFGIWESIGEFSYMNKKLVAVDKNGKFKVRQGYEDKLGWSSSKYRMTFKLKQVSLTDQAEYGINAEVGLAFGPLRDSLNVTMGASSLTGHGDNSSVRNETMFFNEAAALMFPRPPNDNHTDFGYYRIFKNNSAVISIGKQSSGGSQCTRGSVWFDQCQGRYVLRYENDTHMSFNVNNVSQSDEGLYIIKIFFYGVDVKLDPTYQSIFLTVQERPSALPTEQPSATASDVGSGAEQGIALSLRLLSLMAIFLFWCLV